MITLKLTPKQFAMVQAVLTAAKEKKPHGNIGLKQSPEHNAKIQESKFRNRVTEQVWEQFVCA